MEAVNADVAQLVEHRHGKAGVKGSSPFVGSPFFTAASPQFGIVFVRICPRLSAQWQPRNPREGAEYGVLPTDWAPCGGLLTMEVLYQLSYVGASDES